MYDTASELYNDFLRIYYHKCCELSDNKRKKIESKYDPKDLFLDGYDYSMWSENEEELTDKEWTDKEESEDLLSIPLLEANEEEVKEGKD